MTANSEWRPYVASQDVEAGSALDFGPRRTEPAGRKGWLQATPRGTFAFEKTPRRDERFYGTNLCFSAQFLDKPLADQLARRLRQMGYNTVRFHHYDRDVTASAGQDSSVLDAAQKDRLDYLFAALKRQGIYLNIDLFTIRQIRPDEVIEGAVGMDEYKALLLVSDRARQNWLKFARNLLDRENPYTGLKWKDDPALAWIAVVNENNAGSAARQLSPGIQALFDQAYAKAGGQGKWSPTNEAGAKFAGKLHVETFQWMRDQLRGLGVKALLTDNNGWLEQRTLIRNREQLDFVDNHFYWDHPRFLGTDWGLPSSGWSDGRSSIDSRGGGLQTMALTRLKGKPFTVTEINFCAPNPYRGEGGLVLGAIAARQGWDGVWRFAWSHGIDSIRDVRPLDYFNTAQDPLQRASERAVIAQYLRGAVPAAASWHTVQIDPAMHPERGYDDEQKGRLLEMRMASSTSGGQPGTPESAAAKWVGSSVQVDTPTFVGLAVGEQAVEALTSRAARLETKPGTTLWVD